MLVAAVGPWVNPLLVLGGRTTHLHKPLSKHTRFYTNSLLLSAQNIYYYRKSVSTALYKEIIWFETSGYSRLHKCSCLRAYMFASLCIGFLVHVCVHVDYLLLFFSVWNTVHGFYSWLGYSQKYLGIIQV